jgi:hypothetical protein
MRSADFMKFILARETLRQRKEGELTNYNGDFYFKPWTNDPILRMYRFCNVRREDDKVTKWIAENWRNPNAKEKDNWFAMAVARWINWPDTLSRIGYPVPWVPKTVVKTMKTWRADGGKVWTGAYMIGTQGNAKDKIDFVVDNVLSPMWANRAVIRPRAGDCLESFNDRLQDQYAMAGGFMGGQVIADIKYTDQYLKVAKDWWTWAVSGPGSRRGLNRVMGQDPDCPWKEKEWLATAHRLALALDHPGSGLPFKLHMQDIQNCLCEFDKYERVRLGEGRPRSLYPGAL